MDDNTDSEYETFPAYKAGIFIWKTVPPILLVFGTCGNVLSIVVLTGKSIRKSTTGLYLIVLTFSDLAVLYTGLLRQWIIYLFEFDVRCSPMNLRTYRKYTLLSLVHVFLYSIAY